ncbi:MAG: thiamine-phosphate kinase [Candidatus Dactylopiibacterium carminicum]|uniref:Thiamine-monophosphate kinase n=1 Tax=Candidatus Dactylopiibacterium carminicum TaxID=857335 RepID=A0A272EZ31_9RHOO|nr:thiamine-phosphate kinase [Candidatus Dactylopiibacterium carminicum]KAF7600797.1 thiamine-phosphate kinase [Candidatus Dactylopiibacterium carminicum]PAS95296.1 MAG: thiamine-phosphate kinase [Candidatus Dactylopiibacterium carminicum]PAS98692.1 MAG: thiamine-phosphate kinase [Candidatus Dactylopiibacterium carminicum]PAT00804.1 MAG: thiamine-phosphate kinase [Candidatus Dactylopiibacterium carminicum]
MAGEFDLIRRYFNYPTSHTELGVGDDGALCVPRPGMQLVVSTDMLVAGTHFLPEADPGLLGWKAAAVNVSDMAAMGAEPRWITLAISLPAVDESWVAAFARGFRDCCEAYGVDWIGGDTTRGPLNLAPTVFGEVPAGRAIRRDGARHGDDVWISGWPGMAALGLAQVLGELQLVGAWGESCLERLHRPMPRVALGCALRGTASAMLDVSDGLLGDLAHILERSAVGAVLDEPALPLECLLAACRRTERATAALLSGGDDYELLFTAPRERRGQVEAIGRHCELPLHRIGRILDKPGLWLQRGDGVCEALPGRGYEHFRN